jgi:TolA-binding protein
VSVVELHPEDLFDKDARGELTAAERARFEAHLERCDACRFERAVRRDFAAELEGEDDSAWADLVTGALAGAAHATGGAEADSPNPADGAARTRPPREGTVAPLLGSGTRARSRRTWLLTLAALLAGGLAAAAGGPPAMRWVASTWRAPGANEAPAPAQSVAPRSDHRSRSPARAPLAPAPVASAASETPPVALETGPAVRAPESRSALDRPLPAGSSRPQDPSPAERFARANAARRSGDHALALAEYRELVRRYPETREAAAAHVIVGRLLLDRGDTRDAEAEFGRYLESDRRELREQALAQRALSFEREGNGPAEEQAWRALLEAYPDTAYGNHARQRLDARTLVPAKP